MEYRYHLDPTSRKHNCPDCDQRTFVRYVDAESGNYAPEQFGRCDREDTCGYHNLPPRATKCFLMNFKKLQVISEKAFKATATSGETDFIPKSQVYEHEGNSCWISNWYLEKSKFTYLTNDYKYFDYNNHPIEQSTKQEPKKPPVTKPVSYIPDDLLKGSLKCYSENNFVKYLVNLFGADISSQLITRYFIGTSKHRFSDKDHPGYKSESGANIFWQIDTTGKIRSGKIMLYKPETGKRVKDPFNHISWVHNWLKQPDFVLKQCFFGEHLLRDTAKPIAIVESEKTAIIASVYLPRFIWIAAGMKGGLNIAKCSILKGRNITLFPDIMAYTDWNKKAKELSTIARVNVSGLLESKATPAEREQGLDIADYLIRFDLQAFRATESEPGQPDLTKLDPIKPVQEPEPPVPAKHIINLKTPEPIEQRDHYHYPKPATLQPESWEQEISDLEQHFKLIALPAQPIKLNEGTTIMNIPLFIESHLAVVKAQNGNRTFQPYVDRLTQLKALII